MPNVLCPMPYAGRNMLLRKAIEQPINLPQKLDDGTSFRISPWKIANFAVNLS